MHRLRLVGLAVILLLLAGQSLAVPAQRANPNVRVLTTGDNSELVKTIPIGKKRGQKEKVVMSLPGSKLGNLSDGMAIEASAELEVTTCLKANENHPGAEDKCTGKPYGFSRWQVEKREYGLWVPAHPVRRRLVPIWRPARTVWKQNHVFKLESS